MNRKKFLQLSTLGLTTLSLKPLSARNLAEKKPIIISTWDSGMKVNAAGWEVLKNGGQSLDAVETAAVFMEDQPDCCVGLGGYPDRDGVVTLDASIMNGNGNSGAVSGLERIKHPVSVARKVMEKTPHILLTGNGAQQFALENGFRLEDGKLSLESERVYKEWLKKSEYKPERNIENRKGTSGPFAPQYFDDGTLNHDTMGILAMDKRGDMSGAVTTSGMAFKLHGRVGDSPIIGGGLFVDNDAGCATSSGLGEEVMRICGTHLVVEMMRMGYSPEAACKKAVERILIKNKNKTNKPQVGFVAMDKNGRHGAYAVFKGFVYSLKTETENKIIKAKYILS